MFPSPNAVRAEISANSMVTPNCYPHPTIFLTNNKFSASPYTHRYPINLPRGDCYEYTEVASAKALDVDNIFIFALKHMSVNKPIAFLPNIPNSLNPSSVSASAAS